jgi:hypothetical protein
MATRTTSVCFASTRTRTRSLIAAVVFVAIMAALASPAQAALLDHKSVSIQNSGGSGGAGASTSDMVFDRFSADGWGWAGGAGGVQGSLGGTKTPANETFKFNVGSTVDSLNVTYGAGNWTIDNPTLTFNSSYSQQNNPRFGRGNGDFDIYWVGNDNWAQSRGTTTDRELNPVYATSAAELLAWSGSQSLLGSETFTLGGSGYVSLSYSLDADSAFLNDILSASAVGSNQAASLYLMSMSDTLGMIIFTGGQGQALPTLSFDVVSVETPSVPEPGTLAIWSLLGACGFLPVARRWRKSV